MMESVGLIALGYIIAVAGAESTAVIIAGLLVMLAGWFFLIRSGHGTLHPKARQVAAARQVEEQKVMAIWLSVFFLKKIIRFSDEAGALR